MTQARRLRIVLLTRWGAPSGVLIAEALSRTPHQLIGIVCERRLVRRLRFDRWALQQCRTHGLWRIAGKLLEWSLWRARSAVRNRLPPAWRRGWSWKTVEDVQRDLGIPVHTTHDINDAGVRRVLDSMRPDLLILANTAIVKRDVLAAAPQGCLNIHLGALPKYRGLAAVFWALYHGEPSVGVTIHYVDEGIDTGDLVEQASIPAGPGDTEATLTLRAQQAGAELMRRAVERIAAGTVVRRPQEASSAGWYRWPSPAQRRELAWRLRRSRRQSVPIPWKLRAHQMFKRCLRYLVGCSMGAVRALGVAAGLVRPALAVRILMYHKISDDDVFLSVPPRVFEAQMRYLRHHCHVMSLAECVDRLRVGAPFPPNAVAVTFDDGYADNYHYAFPILARYQIPATIFLTAQYLGTNARLPHDQAAGVGEHDGQLLSWAQVLEMAAGGVAFGSHSQTHAQLKGLPDDHLRWELMESKRLLQEHLGRPIDHFSYPFGSWLDIDERVMREVERCGYTGACTALEGTNDSGTWPYGLRRTMVEASDTLFLFKRLMAGDLDALAVKDTPLISRLKRRYRRWLLAHPVTAQETR